MSEIIKFDKYEIEVETRGSITSEPIIFLHGGPGAHYHQFEDKFDALESKYFIIFYNQIGCGQSKSIVDYELSDDVEVFKHILNYFSIKETNIVGESWGTYFGMYLYTLLKSRIKKLILLSSVGTNISHLNEFSDNLLSKISEKDNDLLNEIELDESMNSTEKLNKQMSIWNSYYLYDQRFIDQVHTKVDINEIQYQLVVSKFNQLELDYNFSMLNSNDITFIQATHDITDINLIKNISNKLDKSNFVEVQNCGHWIYMEKTKWLNDWIINNIK